MVHTRESIEALISKNDRAVVKGLQTVSRVVGFSPSDHQFGSSLVSQIQRWEETPEKARNYPFPLSRTQLEHARTLLKRYLAVLVRVANEKGDKVEHVKEKAANARKEQQRQEWQKQEEAERDELVGVSEEIDW